MTTITVAMSTTRRMTTPRAMAVPLLLSPPALGTVIKHNSLVIVTVISSLGSRDIDDSARIDNT